MPELKVKSNYSRLPKQERKHQAAARRERSSAGAKSMAKSLISEAKRLPGTMATPFLQPADEALVLPFASLVRHLVAILGLKLTAYIGSAADTSEVESWEKGTKPAEDVEARLRFAYRVARDISGRFGPSTAQAWFQGVNPELDDQVVLQLIRESNLLAIGSEIIAAENAFLEA